MSNSGSQYGNAWVETTREAQQSTNGQGASTLGTYADGRSYYSEGFDIAKQAKLDPLATKQTITSATCTRCGAWRGELGSEPLPDCLAWARGVEPCSVCFVCHLVVVFRAVRRVLHDTGVCWINLGDSYNSNAAGNTVPRAEQGNGNGRLRIGGTKQAETFEHNRAQERQRVPGLGPKQLLMMPARVALALQADGWTLRSDVTWAKKAPMPESVVDRPTNATEHIFLLAKNPRYYYDPEAVRQPYSPMTTDTGQRKRMIAAGKFSTEDEFAPRATGSKGGVGERMFRLNEGGANMRNFWVDDEDEAPSAEERLSQFLDFAADYLGETQATALVDAFNQGMDGTAQSDFWLLGPEPYAKAHFATFPSEIPRRAILCSTSARGQCPACGSPWARIAERDQQPQAYEDRKYDRTDPKFATKRNLGARYQAQLDAHPRQTTGWEQSCSCPPHEPCPQTVLDPFLGSGTTAFVARHHGRRAIGVELNEEYARLAADRLRQGTLGLEIF